MDKIEPTKKSNNVNECTVTIENTLNEIGYIKLCLDIFEECNLFQLSIELHHQLSTNDENLELPFEPNENFLAAIFSDCGHNIDILLLGHTLVVCWVIHLLSI